MHDRRPGRPRTAPDGRNLIVGRTFLNLNLKTYVQQSIEFGRPVRHRNLIKYSMCERIYDSEPFRKMSNAMNIQIALRAEILGNYTLREDIYFRLPECMSSRTGSGLPHSSSYW